MRGTSVERIGAVFKQWRANRPGRSKIPDELWEMAVEGVQAFSLSQVAKAAQLDFYQLRSRVEKKKLTTNQLAPVSVTKVIAAAAPQQVTNVPFIEIETSRGSKIRFFNESEALKAVLSHVLGE